MESKGEEEKFKHSCKERDRVTYIQTETSRRTNGQPAGQADRPDGQTDAKTERDGWTERLIDRQKRNDDSEKRVMETDRQTDR
jgi:hypothetical protein